jgi:hypothetical protein
VQIDVVASSCARKLNEWYKIFVQREKSETYRGRVSWTTFRLNTNKFAVLEELGENIWALLGR